MTTLPPGWNLSTIFPRQGIVHAVLTRTVHVLGGMKPDAAWEETSCQLALGQGLTPQDAIAKAVLDALGDA